MTLQQQAVQAVDLVPEEKLQVLIEFARFLSVRQTPVDVSIEKKEDITEKRKSIAGILKGKIWMADDFNETPECFKEYV